MELLFFLQELSLAGALLAAVVLAAVTFVSIFFLQGRLNTVLEFSGVIAAGVTLLFLVMGAFVSYYIYTP